MPNPLAMATARLNIGKRADDRLHAVPPRPESYAGENNPYRGTNDHGVPVHVVPDDHSDYLIEDNHSGEYEPAREPVDAIPVRVVREFTRELRRWRTGQEILDSSVAAAPIVRMIAPRNPARTSITIVNTGAGTVILGETESVASYTGFALLTGKDKTFYHEDAIYAVAATGIQTVSMAEEFTVRET